MNFDKLINKFVNDYLALAPYANKDEIEHFVKQMRDLIITNKDKTPREIIDIMLEENIREIDVVREKYGIPGFTIGMQVGNIRIKLYGGTLNNLGNEMTENALFDIASMTKFYTQVICYHLIQERYFSLNDKIMDIDTRFTNIGDLTIRDILTFGTTFRSNGLIKNASKIEEAKDILFNVNVVEKNKYNYNDIGMMIIKEVMEHVTGHTYEELLDKYIIKAYNLKNTHLIVPKCKLKLVTGTPNFLVGHINDASANALGGFSGHAGIFSASDDLLKFLMESHSKVPNISDAYTPGKLNDAVGIMGNAYVSHPTGLVKSFVDTLEPIDTIAIQGSTRVNANASHDSAHDILFNPGSMGMEEAKERVAKINEIRSKEGKSLIDPIKVFTHIRDGEKVNSNLIDTRTLVPISEMEKIIKKNAITILKLRFFNEVIAAYTSEYENEIKYTRKVN